MADTEEYTTQIDSDIADLDEYLAKALSGQRRKQNLVKAKALLKTFRKCLGHRTSLCKFRNKDKASVLDMAIRCGDVELTSSILDMCPELVTYQQVKGQTVFHIALSALDNTEATVNLYEKMLASAGDKVNELLNSEVTETDVHTPVMAKELPLFIAAIQFQESLVELFLQNGASLFVRNQRGDTVFHRLIRHIGTQREFIPDAMRMVEFLHQKVVDYVPKKVKPEIEDCDLEAEDQNDENSISKAEKRIIFKHIWYVRNLKENKTALQLAAMYGIKPLVEQILHLKDVYYSHSDEDGTYDEKIFDITEIDSVACQKSQLSESTASTWFPCIPNYKGLKSVSILEILVESERAGSDITDIIEIKPIRRLIHLKWEYYRKFYALWMLVHFLFTVLYSIYAVEHSNIHFNNSGTQLQKDFVMVVRWIALLFGFVFLLVGIAAILPRTYKCLHCRKCPPCTRICKFKLFQRWRLFRTHNTDHVLIYIIFAVSVIVESILNIADVQYVGVVKVMAVISCWWFNIFFLGLNKSLSFVAVLFREIIVRDVLRICIFIGSQLSVFTAVMHMLYQGVGIPAVNGHEYDPDPENAPTYQISMFAMLNLMLGLGGIESMDKSRCYYAAVVVYVIFVLLTHIIFFNALIATTSSTCAEISNDKERRFVLQRLSMILYMEDVITIFLDKINPLNKMEGVRENKNIVIYDPIIVEVDKKWKKCNRYYLDMRTPSYNNSMKDINESQDKKINEKVSRDNAKSVDYISQVLIKSLSKLKKKSLSFRDKSTPYNYVPTKEYVPEKTIQFTVTRPFEPDVELTAIRPFEPVDDKEDSEEVEVDVESHPINDA